MVAVLHLWSEFMPFIKGQGCPENVSNIEVSLLMALNWGMFRYSEEIVMRCCSLWRQVVAVSIPQSISRTAIIAIV